MPPALTMDHVAIAVRSLAQALPVYRDVLGLRHEGSEEVASQGVATAFLDAGHVHIELLEPLSPDSPVGRFIESRGEGIHHVAFRVPDAQAALDEARRQGLRLIDEHPRPGSRGLLIGFVHPKGTNGVLVEFCQQP